MDPPAAVALSLLPPCVPPLAAFLWLRLPGVRSRSAAPRGNELRARGFSENSMGWVGGRERRTGRGVCVWWAILCPVSTPGRRLPLSTRKFSILWTRPLEEQKRAETK